ncbi:MAG: hypothetical protein AAF995_08155 [Planctomycetota bacterium]
MQLLLMLGVLGIAVWMLYQLAARSDGKHSAGKPGGILRTDELRNAADKPYYILGGVGLILMTCGMPVAILPGFAISDQLPGEPVWPVFASCSLLLVCTCSSRGC